MPYKDIKRENDSTSIPSFKSMTKAELLEKYVKGDCKLCKHRKGLNIKFPKNNIGPCIECDRGNEMNWELDMETLKGKVK